MEDAALLLAAGCFIALLVVLYICITSAVVPRALHPDKKVRAYRFGWCSVCVYECMYVYV